MIPPDTTLTGRLIDSVISLGPIGVFCLAGLYLWLRYGRKNGSPVGETQAQRWHAENRDTIRDVALSTARIELAQQNMISRVENNQKEILTLMRLTAEHQRRLGEILTRLESRPQ